MHLLRFQGPRLLLVTLAVWSTLPTRAALVERWTFNGLTNATSGTVSLGVNGRPAVIRGANALSTGAGIRLPGGPSSQAAYIDLPNGLLAGKTELTVEVWLTLDGRRSWQRVFDFGSTAGGELSGPGGGGAGQSYLMLAANRGTIAGANRVEFARDGSIVSQVDTSVEISLGRRHLFTYVWNQNAGGRARQRWYLDGVLQADTGALTGGGGFGGSLGDIADINNWLGRSNWTADENTEGIYDECSIYDHAMSPEQVLARFTAGPVPGPQLQFHTGDPDSSFLSLVWSGGDEPILQTASSILGPWFDVSGAKSPYRAPDPVSSAYYRLKDGKSYAARTFGVIRRQLVAGDNLVCNPLQIGNNNPAQVWRGALDGTVVFGFAKSQFSSPNVNVQGRWTDTAASYPPGRGYLLRSPSAVRLEFWGEVPAGVISQPLERGYNLVSSVVPQAGKLEADLKYVPANGDIVHRRRANGSYFRTEFDFLFGGWDIGDPILDLGEAFFLERSAPGEWVRTFIINP